MKEVALLATGQYSLGGNDLTAGSLITFKTVGLTGTCSVIPRVRRPGDGSTNMVAVPYTNVNSDVTLAAGTAITADGVYQITATGPETVLDATVTSGTATVDWWIATGIGGGGSGGGGTGGAVTSVDGGIVSIGTKADAAITDYTLPATVISSLKGISEVLQGTGAGAVVPVKQQDGSGNVQPAGDTAGRPIFVAAQGEVADASSATGVSSLIIGGTDTGGLARTAANILLSTTPTSTSFYGLSTYASLAGLSSANVVRPLVTASGFTPGGSAAQTITVVPCRAVTSSTYEQEYNNLNVTLLSSLARTTTQTSADQTNFNHTKLVVVLDVTAGTTPALTVTINGKDAASGKYYNLLTGASVSTVSTNIYTIAIGLTPVANTTVSAFIPRLFQIVVSAGNGNSITYSVGYSLVQ
jgi:hypothetical protein